MILVFSLIERILHMTPTSNFEAHFWQTQKNEFTRARRAGFYLYVEDSVI